MPQYEVRVESCLDQEWKAWFEPLRLCPQSDGTTLLVGILADQAALHGVLAKLRDLGIPLLSVVQVHDQPVSLGTLSDTAEGRDPRRRNDRSPQYHRSRLADESEAVDG